MNVPRAIPLAVLSLLSVVVTAPRARACGGLVQPISGTVGTDVQRAFFSVRASGITEIVLQVTVPDTANDYGVLVPVPAMPTLSGTPVSADEIDNLEASTRPSFFEATSGGGSSCGCGATGTDKGNLSAGGGITIGQVVTIGPVAAVSLTADDASALDNWLVNSGFVIPASAQAIVNSYVGTGKWFVAFRRASPTANTFASSVGVRMTVDGDHREFAMRMASLGTTTDLAITVFVVAAAGVGPSSPYTALTINDLDAELVKGWDYRGAVKKAVTAAGGRAWVNEGVHASASAISGGTLATLVDSGSRVTRLTTVMEPSRMDADLAFTAAAPSDVPTSRTLAAGPGAGSGGGTRFAGTSIPPGMGMMFMAIAMAVAMRSLVVRRA